MGYNVIVAGATGAVGTEMILALEQFNFPVDDLKLLASARSVGKKLKFRGREIAVEELTKDSFKGYQIAFFSAGGGRSLEFAPAAAAAGCVVIDNSSAYRMDPQVPLVVPEVNPEAAQVRPKGIIANPNCSTIIMNVPVWPLHQANPVTRMVVSTYQAVSGAGAWGLWELDEQIKAYANGQPIAPNKFPHQIVNNVFAHNSAVGANGYNEEEMKMVNETRKIFSAPGIMVTATCVRVPVPRAHCEAINLEFSRPITPAEVRAILAKAPGVKIVDEPAKNHFPMPLEASNQDDILVGRIRQDISRTDGRGIDLFVAGDQIRKGAATNAIQIAQVLAERRWL
ncbi:MAG TPA: aspartate-semialdehyde dehydrogenase [bacterium]|nr:aspartate-semialdehyde dehydrogenase [bacterium]